MFKVQNHMATEIFNDVFKKRTITYKLRNHNSFERIPVYSVVNVTETFSYLIPRIWDLMANDIEQLDSTKSFNLIIKKWVRQGFSCMLCKKYIYQVGFL